MNKQTMQLTEFLKELEDNLTNDKVDISFIINRLEQILGITKKEFEIEEYFFRLGQASSFIYKNIKDENVKRLTAHQFLINTNNDLKIIDLLRNELRSSDSTSKEFIDFENNFAIILNFKIFHTKPLVDTNFSFLKGFFSNQIFEGGNLHE